MQAGSSGRRELVVAGSDDIDDTLQIAKVEVRCNTLGVEVESEVHNVDVSGPFAVSKQTTLNTICTCHKS